ncbi:hypothetical protein I4U23_012073 [Adineta vaga]|nr:hypothetical protein I4U23_012073 [Adineta vaga]
MAFLRTTIISAVLCLVCILSIQARVIANSPKQCCPEDEVFKSCGTACPLTCEDIRNSTSDDKCTKQCVKGCFCQEGYVRETDKNSACIKSELCSSTTLSPDECSNENEIHQDCGSACPETCNDVLQPDSTKACTLQCVEGCFCKKGYVRDTNNNGTCIERERCKLTTLSSDECSNENEIHQECGTACPETCEDVLKPNPEKMCTLQCVKGCFCQEGYVRASAQDSTCIKRDQCSP